MGGSTAAAAAAGTDGGNAAADTAARGVGLPNCGATDNPRGVESRNTNGSHDGAEDSGVLRVGGYEAYGGGEEEREEEEEEVDQFRAVGGWGTYS